MRRINFLQIVAVAGFAAVLYLATGEIAAAERTGVRSAAVDAAEAKIHKALDSKTEIEFFDQPLSDVLQFIENYHSIQIEVDERALDDLGISTDQPITRKLKGITLRSALNLLLEELDLCWEVHDEVLMITSIDEASERMLVRVYDVSDLLGDDPTAAELSKVVNAVFPKSVGEGGSVTPFHHMLIVRNPQFGQEQIQRLLAEMRRLTRKPGAATGAREPNPFGPEAE